MKLAVIGTGYVGLVTGSVFADFGNQVVCLDIDVKKIDSLKQAKVPFFEPGLEELVKKNIDQKRLSFSTSYPQTVPEAEAVFICVGTPSKNNGEADLTYVQDSLKEAIKHITNKTLIVIKSTVPVGADEEFEKLIPDGLKQKIEFASCPEFLREGSAVLDATKPDRIVIGTTSEFGAQLLSELYKSFNSPILICDLRSAQMIKYVSNTFLATKISFANAVARLCEKVGADVKLVLEGAGMDKRIGRTFFYPGVGFGGSCFPKDVSAFISIFKDNGLDATLLESVENINETQIDLSIEKIRQALGDLNGKVVTILGLAFKPNTDDLRQAPSLKIIKKLLNLSAKIKAYDPAAMENAKQLINDPNVEFAQNPLDALKDADLMLLVTEWNEFKELDLKKVKKIMKQAIVVDGRNIYDPVKVKALGFKYFGIGRN